MKIILADRLSGISASSHSAILLKVRFNLCNYCHAILCSSAWIEVLQGTPTQCFKHSCWKKMKRAHNLVKYVFPSFSQSNIREITFSLSCSWKYLSSSDSARRGGLLSLSTPILIQMKAFDHLLQDMNLFKCISFVQFQGRHYLLLVWSWVLLHQQYAWKFKWHLFCLSSSIFLFSYFQTHSRSDVSLSSEAYIWWFK